MQNTAIILRGLPGAGKSFWVNNFLKNLPNELAELIQNHGYFSTDNLFINNNQYQFKAEQLQANHQQNLQLFCQALHNHIPVIICDNTNIHKWEYEPYEKAAKEKGYHVEIITIGNPHSEEEILICAKRNQHGVSLKTITNMANNFEPHE